MTISLKANAAGTQGELQLNGNPVLKFNPSNIEFPDGSTQGSAAYTKAQSDAQFAKLRAVLIVNGLPTTTPAPGYVPLTLLWGGGPLNPLGMYNISTGVITIVESGLYRFAGQFRMNNPGVSEADISLGMTVVTGNPEGSQEFVPLITGWPASAEVRWIAYAATFRCVAGDQFKYQVSAASGNGCSVGGGNVTNSQVMVTRIG